MGMKKTEIGMIPEDWDVKRFSDTFRILNNNTYSRAELNYASGQFRNIHYGDVLILFPEVLDCTREDVPYINDGVRISSSAQPLQDGDVVMADTAEDETAGKVTEVTNTSDKPVMAGLHTIPFRVKSGEFVPKWLGYYMNSHLYHDQLLPYIHGTKVSSVSKGSLGDTVIIIPKTFEQEKIVNALSDVDALIEKLKKLIRKKKDIRRGTTQMLVTGKKRLDGFDGEWVKINLSKNSKLKARIGWQGLTTDEYLDEGYSYLITGTDFKDGRINWNGCHYVNYDRYVQDTNIQVSNGDLLLTKDGTIGKVAYISDLNRPATLNSGVFVVKPITDAYHIFPKDYCIGKKYDKSKWNSIVNKTPISASSNREIGGVAPSTYLGKLEKKGSVLESDLDGYVETHWIDHTLLRNDEFQDFIIDRAKKLLSAIEVATGRTISGKDSDEVQQAFGASLI